MATKINYNEEMIKKCEYLDRTGRIPYKQSTPFGIADFTQFYVFTTENIAGYINEFDLKDKSLMTVGSSGDQVISAILQGSKDITHYDLNPYSKYYIYFKLASILALSKEEFCEFINYFVPFELTKPMRINFRLDLYKKIRRALKALDKEVFQIWEILFENYNPQIIKKALFIADGSIVNCSLSRIIPYLSSSSAYDETKAKIKKATINFLAGNITEANFARKFDNIWLSNIPQYLTIAETKIMLERLVKYVNKDGKMLMAYIYNNLLPHNVNYCPNEFQSFNPSLVQFECFNQELLNRNHKKVDEAIIYQKR